jgi:cytochrome c peroxidase
MKTRNIVLLFVLIIIIVAYAFMKMPETKGVNTDKISDKAVKEVIVTMQDNGCLACHSGQAVAPFYGSFPVIGEMVKEDMRLGLRAMDLQDLFQSMSEGKLIPEVSLAKIEKVIADGTMPPANFSAAHWSSSIDDKEKATILNWVKSTRLAHYSTNKQNEKFANEPIQPLVDKVDFDAAKAELGLVLYSDTRLSGDNTLSCASCHDLATGGVDRRKVSVGIDGQLGGINAPTVYNAVFNIRQFWDGRAKDLQEQAGGPPLNPIEMGSKSWNDITEKLDKDTKFKEAFTAVYPEGFTGETITDAIAEFEKTLVTPNCAFDKYLKGDENAISADAKEGYKLFKQNGCATCHVGQAMGGQSFEYMGIFGDYFADRGGVVTEADNGLYNVTKKESDKHKFKVPLLRNIALTPPYFHDGSAENLNDAVMVMLKYQKGREIVSDEEINKIVSFLNTLNGEYQGEVLK